MVDAFVGPLVGKLQEVALSEAKALLKVNDDIRRLRDKLMWLQAFLREADPSIRLAGNELVRVLVCQTREVAFDAEDAIDQYQLLVEPLRSRRGWAHFFCLDSNFLARFRAQFTVRHHLSGKIAIMNERLEDIVKNNEKYKLDGVVAPKEASGSNLAALAATAAAGLPSWNAKPCDLIGRMKEEEKLKKLLLRQCSHDKDVVCVAGVSGVGKTSLVRNAYEDAEIRGHFAIHIWTSFPPDTSDWIILPEIYRIFFDASSALNDLNHETGQQEEMNLDKNGSGNMVGWTAPYEKWKNNMEIQLSNQSYLLVLDCRQISITKWQRILDNLPRGVAGSKIMLITELDEGYTGEDSTINLSQLEEDTCIELFTCILSSLRNDPLGSEMVKKIYGITGGLPLAVVLLARLLQTMETSQREHVFDHISKSNKQAKRLERILSHCLNDLPHDLKSCFLYLAGFPENRLISAQQLVHLWMAEGLLTPKDGKKMEKIGHRYLKELIARGLVQLVAMDGRGNVEYITIHEHIHAFLRLEARESSFLEVHYGYYVPATARVRRLSLQNYKNKLSALTNPLPKLRTIMSYFEDHEGEGPNGRHPKVESKELDIRGLLRNSPFLRVINLEGIDVGFQLPKKIGDMVHLRYLGVRSSKLRKIHRSIGNLYNLQTLDVRGTQVRILPDAFWKIGTLRHILGNKLRFPDPKSAGDLKHLETFENTSLKDDKYWDGTIMKKMFNLRVLHIVGIKECHNTVLKVALNELNYLLYLTLSGETIGIDIRSHRKDHLVFMNLQGKLDITELNEGSSTSSHGRQISLSNLSKLVLKQTHMDQDFINKLASLKNLTSLLLLNDSFDGEKLVFPPNGFKKLKMLRVSHLDKVEKEKKIVVRSKMENLETFELIEFNGCVEAESPPIIDAKINKTFYSKEVLQYTESCP